MRYKQKSHWNQRQRKFKCSTHKKEQGYKAFFLYFQMELSSTVAVRVALSSDM